MTNISTQSRQQETMTPRTGTRETGQNMHRQQGENDYPPDANKTCLQAKGQHPHPDTMALTNKTRTSRHVNQTHEGIQPMRQKPTYNAQQHSHRRHQLRPSYHSRYPIGCTMIPSSGIMHDNNLGANIIYLDQDSRPTHTRK
jgi:hypothetical protein